MRDKNPTVYSTDPSFRAPGKAPAVSLPPEQQTVAIHLEKKGRGGKTVNILKGLQLTDGDLKKLGKELKRVCGTGGTIKAGTIEIQGEHREKIDTHLKSLGFRTKFVGG